MHTSHPKTCEHKLKYCPECDIVFCEICKREWRKETLDYRYTTSSLVPYSTPYYYNNCSHGNNS